MANYSKQREVVLDVLRSTKSHPTAFWIHERAKELLPNISLATVYRNLGLLENSGEIVKIQSSFEKDRYDGNPNRHTHLVCDECGAVVDVSTSEFLDAVIQREAPIGSRDYFLVYYGICQDCMNK